MARNIPCHSWLQNTHILDCLSIIIVCAYHPVMRLVVDYLLVDSAGFHHGSHSLTGRPDCRGSPFGPGVSPGTPYWGAAPWGARAPPPWPGHDHSQSPLGPADMIEPHSVKFWLYDSDLTLHVILSRRFSFVLN